MAIHQIRDKERPKARSTPAPMAVAVAGGQEQQLAQDPLKAASSDVAYEDDDERVTRPLSRPPPLRATDPRPCQIESKMRLRHALAGRKPERQRAGIEMPLAAEARPLSMGEASGPLAAVDREEERDVAASSDEASLAGCCLVR